MLADNGGYDFFAALGDMCGHRADAHQCQRLFGDLIEVCCSDPRCLIRPPSRGLPDALGGRRAMLAANDG
jgi:hypothetical protein